MVSSDLTCLSDICYAIPGGVELCLDVVGLRLNPLGLPVDPDHIGIWGQSAGGHLAALAGLSPQRLCEPTSRLQRLKTVGGFTKSGASEVQAVVTIGGPSDLTRPGGEMRIDRPSPVTALVGGDSSTHLEQLRAASPVAHVKAGAPPYLIVHGTSDETVPYGQAESLHRALVAVGADSRLLPIAGGHHNLLEDPDAPYDGQVWYDVADEAVQFFRHRLLGQHA
jgi:dipeptidyl aminopeptidase/acylaminoacyl peptidase